MDKSLYCDLDLCTGCYACVAACMDENDVNLAAGEVANRRIHTAEQEGDTYAYFRFASVSCMHCEDSPCMIGCPTGAIYKDAETNSVQVNRDLCIGCHSCALACHSGVPRYDGENKMTKCDMCVDRVKAGLTPACVRVCPVKALSFMSSNEVSEEKEKNYFGKLMGEMRKYS